MDYPLFKLLKQFKLTYKFSPPICQAVSIAKDTGMELFYPNTTAEWKKLIDYHDISWDDNRTSLDKLIRLCSDLFTLSIRDTDTIDFSDMIWMPLAGGMDFPKYDFVFIDEAQDTNATRREVAKRLLKEGPNPGRLIAVGDQHQAIFGFTGADNDSLALLQKDFQMETLSLTTSFRCSKAVIAHAQKIVPHIQARPDAPEGSVSEINELDFHKALIKNPSLHSTSAILCRKNAPLMSVLLFLASNNIPCRFEGKDQGDSYIRLIKKLEPTS